LRVFPRQVFSDPPPPHFIYRDSFLNVRLRRSPRSSVHFPPFYLPFLEKFFASAASVVREGRFFCFKPAGFYTRNILLSLFFSAKFVLYYSGPFVGPSDPLRSWRFSTFMGQTHSCLLFPPPSCPPSVNLLIALRETPSNGPSFFSPIAKARRGRKLQGLRPLSHEVFKGPLPKTLPSHNLRFTLYACLTS